MFSELGHLLNDSPTPEFWIKAKAEYSDPSQDAENYTQVFYFPGLPEMKNRKTWDSQFIHNHGSTEFSRSHLRQPYRLDGIVVLSVINFTNGRLAETLWKTPKATKKKKTSQKAEEASGFPQPLGGDLSKTASKARAKTAEMNVAAKTPGASIPVPSFLPQTSDNEASQENSSEEDTEEESEAETPPPPSGPRKKKGRTAPPSSQPDLLPLHVQLHRPHRLPCRDPRLGLPRSQEKLQQGQGGRGRHIQILHSPREISSPELDAEIEEG